MDIVIVKGDMNYINDCEEALVNSELGNRYFLAEGKARSALEEGFSKNEIYVAIDQNNKCLGFMWVITNGMFHSYPYLHIIAVKKEIRGLGIGKQLLKYLEDKFKDHKKMFLVAADFNPRAKKLYEAIGYKEVGVIPGLYLEGITEYIMMKLL
jgi:ribosomal protein S18 acetylase RimI-like enzyme